MRALVYIILAFMTFHSGGSALSKDYWKEFSQNGGPQAFPMRVSPGPTGTEFLAITANLSPQDREDAIIREILAGNVPDHLNHFIPVNLGVTRDGKTTTATVFVLPDYLSIGTAEDYARIPVNFKTARRLANALGLMLPTTKIVDAVYEQAELRLKPKPLAAGPNMCTNKAYFAHNEMINRQAGAAIESADLIAGHKKDIVVNWMQSYVPDHIAIYGWHKDVGDPIQNLSLVHTADYVDYSHGLRLVSGIVLIDGKQMPLIDVLESPALAPVLSAEGAINGLRSRILADNGYPNI